jgi:hypothetical protein
MGRVTAKRPRWAVALAGQKNEKKSGVVDGLQGNTGRIQMGRERKT